MSFQRDRFRWQPIYTMLGLPDGSHYWPFSKLFTTTEDRVKCVVSSACCLACAYGAYVLAGYSVYNWIKYYYVPLLFQGLWIIMITYLQHQDEEIEVYEQSEWHFIRGQAQTIDRTYGFGIDTLIHHISDGKRPPPSTTRPRSRGPPPVLHQDPALPPAAGHAGHPRGAAPVPGRVQAAVLLRDAARVLQVSAPPQRTCPD